MFAFRAVEQLSIAKTREIEGIIQQLSPCSRWANPRLVRVRSESPTSSKEHLHASIALLTVRGRLDSLSLGRCWSITSIKGC